MSQTTQATLNGAGLNSTLATYPEAAEFLRLTPGTLRKQVCQGRAPVPVVRLGHSVRFRWADLLALLNQPTS